MLTQILSFIGSKYDEDLKIGVLATHDIKDYMSTLMTRYMGNVTPIQVLKIALQRDLK